MQAPKDTIVKKRILLVDDERVVRETVKLLLAHDQHTVVEANNGAEALGLFANDSFDLVMTDFEMPFIKGNELASKIRQLSPNQPIVMITGFGHSSGPHNPIDAVLNKPFSLGRLRFVMSQLLSPAGEEIPCASVN